MLYHQATGAYKHKWASKPKISIWLYALMTCIRSCWLAVFHKVSLLEPYCLLAIFLLCFCQPSLPLYFRSRYIKYWLVISIPLNSSVRWCLVAGGHSQGCHGYLFFKARALPGSTNFLGTSAQAHLFVMSLMAYYSG